MWVCCITSLAVSQKKKFRDNGNSLTGEVKHKLMDFVKVIENFLLPGFKILANSLENTCEGFHFSGSTAGWKHETLQNWTPSQVFVKDFAVIFSNFRKFASLEEHYQVQHPLGTIQ